MDPIENTCPICKDTGYTPHHPKCPNRKRTAEAPSAAASCSAGLDGIHARIRQARKAKGISQATAATRIGMRPCQWSFYETGVYVPTARNLRDICHVLGISADWLLGLTQNANNAAD